MIWIEKDVISEYADCRLCPRQCGANRLSGKPGYCGETAQCRVASCLPHFGEEPPISGARGSGTVFFSGCSCRCFFCQNHQISRGGIGEDISPETLCEAIAGLAGQRVHNINFVTPDHFWPHIERACRTLREGGFDLPFVFNGSGYHTPELIDRYADLIDIFLPDFKFFDPALSRHCMHAEDYAIQALASLRRMVEHKGFLDQAGDSSGQTARQGVLVRHLVLPGQVEDSLAILRLLRGEFGRFLPLSLMCQYMPTPECSQYNLPARRLEQDEYEQVCSMAHELGFEYIYAQEDGGDDTFFPDFERPHPFQSA